VARRHLELRASTRLDVAALLLLIGACASPTEPQVLPVSPVLSSLRADGFRSVLHDSGLIVIEGFPADTSLRLAPNARVLVTVRTTSGDSETVSLWSDICPPEPHQCSSVAITMLAGSSVLGIRSALAQVGARLWITSVSGQFGAAWVFDPAQVQSALVSIRLLPGVAIAERDVVGSTSTGPDYSALSGGLPLDSVAVPIRGNGHVEFRAHDTVTISYRRPSGPDLLATLTLP
jgi:hypothetical protein